MDALRWTASTWSDTAPCRLDAADPDRTPAVRQEDAELVRGEALDASAIGVLGYETSGVQGALRFLETECANVQDTFNVLVAPCASRRH